MSNIIYQPEIAKMANLSERSTTLLIDYCNREGIRFKRDWSGKKIYTTQKWVDDSESDKNQGIDFNYGAES